MVIPGFASQFHFAIEPPPGQEPWGESLEVAWKAAYSHLAMSFNMEPPSKVVNSHFTGGWFSGPPCVCVQAVPS